MHISFSRMTQVDRDPDWVFRRLHDPEMLLGCVPGGGLTKLIDSERFEGRSVIGAGPFHIACAGKGRITGSDPSARTASMRLQSHNVRIRMSMAVHGTPTGSELQMSFCATVADRTGLLNRGWVDPIAGDLLDRTVDRIKRQLESTSGQWPGMNHQLEKAT